jgi:putative oxidoreductase
MRKALPELLSRIIIGFVFIESGWTKFHSLSHVTAFFESLHIPLAMILAPFVSAVELSCGVFILLGIQTKLSTLPLMGVMVVALLTAKLEDITGVSSLFEQSEFLYIALLLWLGIYGSTYLSADSILARKKRIKNAKFEQQ